MTFVCISWIFAGPLCWSVIYIGLVQVWVQYPLLFRAVFLWDWVGMFWLHVTLRF